MKSTVIKSVDIVRKWHLIDLKNQVLGRVATDIAKKLMGKHKPNFSPNLDCGDFVVCINAAEVAVTGTKKETKLYQHHSMIPGGFKEYTFNKVMEKDPKKVIIHAIRGMLPKNKLRAGRLKRLKIYADANHAYQQQFKQEVSKE